jgi:hypothetical protein
MSHRNFRYGMSIANHGDNTFKDSVLFAVPRWDSGTKFDSNRLAIEYFNGADVTILFNEIVSSKEMIFAKVTDTTTVRLMQAFSGNKKIHYMAF